MGRRGSMAGLAVEALLDLTKKPVPKVQKFGKWTQQADGGVGVAGKTVDPFAEARELNRTGQISTREMNRSMETGSTPRRWNELSGTNTYDSLEKGEVSEYARALQQKHNAIEPTRTTPIPKGLEGITNPRHVADGDMTEALEAHRKTSQTIADKVMELDERIKRIQADQKAGKLHVRADGTSRPIKDSDWDSLRRRKNDLLSSPEDAVVREWIGDIQSKTGYRNRSMTDQPGGPISGQKGLSAEEIIHQHHGIANAEGGDLFSQTAFISDVFKVNAYRYVAQQYKTTFGKKAANMWNIPGEVHIGKGKGLHAWLTKMGFDGFFKKLLNDNPNMTQQEIMDAVDRFFEEVFDPSLVKIESMIMNAPKKHKWKGLHLPKEVLSDAKQRLADFTLYEEARFEPIMEGIKRGESWAMERRGQLDAREGYVTARNILGENQDILSETPSLIQ